MAYLQQSAKLDLTKMGFEPGAPYLYCAPGGSYECREIPSDGMIDIQGCRNPLQDCITDESTFPCIDDKEECHCSGSGSSANEDTVSPLEQAAMTAEAIAQSDACMAALVAALPSKA